MAGVPSLGKSRKAVPRLRVLSSAQHDNGATHSLSLSLLSPPHTLASSLTLDVYPVSNLFLSLPSLKLSSLRLLPSNCPLPPPLSHLASPLDHALEGLVKRHVRRIQRTRRGADQLTEVHPSFQRGLVCATDARHVTGIHRCEAVKRKGTLLYFG